MSSTFHEYADKVERVSAQYERVAYEVMVRSTKPAKVRVIDAMVKHQGAITSSYVMAGEIVCLVWLDPEKAEAFKADVKPDEMYYRSPTRFDNGTLIVLYGSPEHELADRQARREAEQAMERLGV